MSLCFKPSWLCFFEQCFMSTGSVTCCVVAQFHFRSISKFCLSLTCDLLEEHVKEKKQKQLSPLTLWCGFEPCHAFDKSEFHWLIHQEEHWQQIIFQVELKCAKKKKKCMLAKCNAGLQNSVSDEKWTATNINNMLDIPHLQTAPLFPIPIQFQGTLTVSLSHSLQNADVWPMKKAVHTSRWQIKKSIHWENWDQWNWDQDNLDWDHKNWDHQDRDQDHWDQDHKNWDRDQKWCLSHVHMTKTWLQQWTIKISQQQEFWVCPELRHLDIACEPHHMHFLAIVTKLVHVFGWESLANWGFP